MVCSKATVELNRNVSAYKHSDHLLKEKQNLLQKIPKFTLTGIIVKTNAVTGYRIYRWHFIYKFKEKTPFFDFSDILVT